MVRSLNNFNIRLAYDTIYLITYKGLPMDFIDTFRAINRPSPKSAINVDLNKGSSLTKMANAIVAKDHKSFNTQCAALGLNDCQKAAALAAAAMFGYKLD